MLHYPLPNQSRALIHHGLQIHDIPVSAISIHPHQRQPVVSADGFKDLVSSIAQYGVLQPIHVRQTGPALYELVAGARRLRAAKMLCLSHIPAIILEAAPQETIPITPFEALQQESLHYLDEAETYRLFMLKHGATQEEIAQHLGKPSSAVANKLQLLNFSAKIKARLFESGLSEGHARALLQLPGEEMQLRLLSHITRKSCSVKDTEILVGKTLERLRGKQAQRKPAFPLPRARHVFHDYRLLSGTLQNAVKQLKQQGIHAEYHEASYGDYIQIQVNVKNPLSTAPKQDATALSGDSLHPLTSS